MVQMLKTVELLTMDDLAERAMKLANHRALLGRLPEADRSILVVVHPDVMQRLKTEDGEHLVALERKYGARLTFRTDPSYHREHDTLANAQTGEEIKN